MDPIRTERKFRCRFCRRAWPAWYTVAGQLVNGGDQLVAHCEVEHPEEVARIRASIGAPDTEEE
jgi:hypothetical protein